MKHPILVLTIAIQLAAKQQLFSQEAALTADQDSLREERSYSSDNFTPARAPYAHSNATFLLNNKNLFSLNGGAHIANITRGQVPNFSITPAVTASTLSLRGNAAVLLIDGTPVSGIFPTYYNLNSSEYESVTIIESNSNALSGSQALNGAISLKSRTGRGYDRPTFEFNSYSTLGWNRQEKSILSDGDLSKYWNINNGLAYMQDFGAVDTRVSFNYGTSPVRSTFDSNSHNTSLRINTGFELLPILSTRLILDRKYSFGRPSMAGSTNTSWTETDLSQGTLMFDLKPAEWISINLHHTLTEIDSDDRLKGAQIYSAGETEQNRKFHKALVTFFPTQQRRLKTSIYLGVQQEDADIYFSRGTRSANGVTLGWSKASFVTTSTSGGATLAFNDYLFADAMLRRDKQSFLPEDHNKHDVKIGGVSFVFSKAFNWESKTFSMGRIRGTLGDAEVTGPMPYPYPENYSSTFFAPPSPERNREIGFDLGFIENRLTISVANFKRIMDKVYALSIGPSPGPYYYELGEFRNSGWEVTVSGSPISTENLRLDTKLIWTKGRSEIKRNENSGGGTTVANTTPTWNATLLNQLSWKKIFMTCLIDAREGGDIATYDFVTHEFHSRDGSYAKIREVGAGIQLGAGSLSRWGVTNMSLSIMARNLLNFYTPGGDDDVEEEQTDQYIKSVSAGLTIGF
jgi:hypothetical protein